jgi:aspartyl-tRNA(Asn)/glutamyl-tRNA(Gln) amidotransferase subunit A
VADLGRRLRRGETGAVELAREALAAAERWQPLINAFVTLDPGGALAAAARLEDELAAGRDRGPLHGIPVAVKDLVDTAGLRTTMGSRHFADHVPARDALVVARLRAAGAVIVGKTTTHELAYGPTGDRSANGPGRNPRDPSRMAGGSSAGSAAAVAAGIVPLAIGTDTGGSVRIPAALCGVAGLRPTSGTVPLDGVFPLSPSLDTVGPLAATVEDVALGRRALTGSPDEPPPSPATRPRIGLVDTTGLGGVDPAIATALHELKEGVRPLASVREAPVPFPDAAELARVYATVQSFEAARIHADRIARAPELFDPEVLARLQAAAEVTEAEYARAARRLADVRAGAAARLDGLDALLLPTVPILPPRLGAREGDFGGGWTSVRAALLAFTSPWSVLGLPALTLPGGGQLVGRPDADEALLAVAVAMGFR